MPIAGLGTTRWRVASDIDREHRLFELLSDEEVVLVVGYSDAGVLEVAFRAVAEDPFVFEFSSLVALLQEGKRRADDDR